MKKILVALFAIFLMASCTSSLPARFSRLADKVDSKGANYSEAQWDKANAQFEKLIQEYVDNYDSFNREQKKEINKAIAKYSAAVLKSGVGNAIGVMQDILSELPSTLNDILDGAKGFLEGLGL